MERQSSRALLSMCCFLCEVGCSSTFIPGLRRWSASGYVARLGVTLPSRSSEEVAAEDVISFGHLPCIIGEFEDMHVAQKFPSERIVTAITPGQRVANLG